MTVEELIMEEIENLSAKLGTLKVGSDEYKAVADRLDKLIAKSIEMGKTHIEADLKDRQLELENKKVEIESKQKEQQMEEEKKDRLVKNCISIGGIVLPVAVTIWGTLKSLKFEESGTVTTIMGRGFINKLLPKK